MEKNQFDIENERIGTDYLTEVRVESKIRELVLSQDLGVLCSKSDITAYGSLVAYTANTDLTKILFATLSYTRKYQCLKSCDKVSILIDNRNQLQKRVSQISAVTISGTANKLKLPGAVADAKEKLLEKHNYLHELLESDSCVYFEIDTEYFVYVTHLQEVYKWTAS